MKKLLLYLSDGLGCRNFLYSSFIDYATLNGFEVVILKKVKFQFNAKCCRIIDYPNQSIPTVIDVLKNAKIESELNLFAEKFNNPVYYSYKRKNKSKKLKDRIKNIYKNYLVNRANSQDKIDAIERKMYKYIQNSALCNSMLNLLIEEKPDVVLFTNQRTLSNIPVVLAAEKLNIPTITCIFSWDNLPKGTKIHKSDFYFVWSEYMYNELQKYYPKIESNAIKITGTPQFSSYSDDCDIEDRNTFFKKYSLDPEYLYICFTGDDVTTSPYDYCFLNDLCIEVHKFNLNISDKFRVLFRRSPVDNSNRFKDVLNELSKIVTPIEPLWKSENVNNWQEAYPLLEDTALLKNILYHSELVVNFGSTIAIDASFFNTPAAYVNYQPIESNWVAANSYKYIHFDTIKGLNPVFWVKDKSEFGMLLKRIFDNNIGETLNDAHLWAQRVIMHPVDKVNDRMWEEITNIVGK